MNGEIEPNFKEFCRLADQGNLIPMSKEIQADIETPVSALLKIQRGDYSFLLESVQGGEKWARYTFLGTSPEAVLIGRFGKTEVWKAGKLADVIEAGDYLEGIKRYMSAWKPAVMTNLPPFYGGAVGYFGYESVSQWEKIRCNPLGNLNVPDMIFMIADTVIIFDNLFNRIRIVTNVQTDGRSLSESYEEGKERISQLEAAINAPLRGNTNSRLNRQQLEYTSSMSRGQFEEAVAKAKEYIVDGDILQVVLAQRLSTTISIDPLTVYRSIRGINPSPYLFFLEFGQVSLAGSSPEVLVRCRQGKIELRPIAGTRRRGKTAEEDLELQSDLLNDPKERAEHVMLVDLGRNDVGRVAKIGSVLVNEFMVIENYSHVMHIVSNIIGEKQEDIDVFHVLRSCFPAGTVSGAPKVRAMEIISELEPVGRGPYAGAVGYFGFNGDMDTCITIRTVVIEGKQAHIEVGAGIVADSVPSREYQETMDKAAALLKALENA